MSTYEELQQQIANLQKQAEDVRAKEIEGVVAEIKAKIASFKLTAADLGFTLVAPAYTAGKQGKRAPAAIKYRHPGNADLTWTGRGRAPAWVEAWLAENKGKTKDDLLIDKPQTITAPAPIEPVAPVAAAEEKKEEKKPAAKAEEIKAADTKTIQVEEPAVVKKQRFGFMSN